jgi:hypothetical protein
MRLIGVLLPASADDPVFQTRLVVFQQELAQLGWIVGRNVRIDARWATTNPAEIRRHATELAALSQPRRPAPMKKIACDRRRAASDARAHVSTDVMAA